MERLFDFTMKHKDSKLSKENIVRSAKDHDEKCERCGGTPLKGELCYTTDEYWNVGTRKGDRSFTHRMCEKCMTELLAEKHQQGRGFNVYVSPTQARKQWTPKRGEQVQVRNQNDGRWNTLVYITTVEGTAYPFVCSGLCYKDILSEGKSFIAQGWDTMRKMPDNFEKAKVYADLLKDNASALDVLIGVHNTEGAKSVLALMATALTQTSMALDGRE